ncbi:hypothetical protein KFK09_024437 [Dendrobium nobile]|uniref:Uncharacterized protein n=1 Tax=Dendrobium nobile TaxID=94219 RepID=A0A8T3AJB7_DENNO|nr:hypothetical protein KFK09_024437 [Dendrobium nobile]
MELVVGGKRIVIQGDTGLSKAGVSLKSLIRTIQNVGGFLLELQCFEGVKHQDVEGILTSVQPLIQEFSEVFQSPRHIIVTIVIGIKLARIYSGKDYNSTLSDLSFRVLFFLS